MTVTFDTISDFRFPKSNIGIEKYNIRNLEKENLIYPFRFSGSFFALAEIYWIYSIRLIRFIPLSVPTTKAHARTFAADLDIVNIYIRDRPGCCEKWIIDMLPIDISRDLCANPREYSI